MYSISHESSLKSFDIQIWLLSQATGSVSSGNLSGLTSMAAKHTKLRATILLPLETRKVAVVTPKLEHQNFSTNFRPALLD